MHFTCSEEQLALQDTLRRFMARDCAVERRRAVARTEEGFSREAWARFAELGLLALPFPEEYGGLGGTDVDLMLVMEQFGRGLVLEPYLTTVILAGGLVRDAGSAAQKQALLPTISGGGLFMALAHYEPDIRYELNRVATTAHTDGGGYVLNGAKSVVVGGHAADKLLVSARTDGGEQDVDGISLFLVDRGVAGLAVRGYPTQDGARASEVTLENVRVAEEAMVGPRGGALAHIERAIDRATAALCAEAVGIMEALNEATLEYLKTRKQFGQPIGRFQSLQHRMADMVIAAEQSRSMTTLAAVRAGSQNDAVRRRTVAAAKAYVGQSSRSAGQAAVQLHGGMGMVDELIVSHYFKRLTMINATFGDSDHHLGRFSDLLLAEASA